MKTHSAVLTDTDGRPPVAEPREGTPPPDDPAACFETLFLQLLPTIRHVLSAVARQHHLSPDDAEEFKSTALLRIIDHDYAVLRKFRQRCSWRTYLTVVAQRLCLDFRIAQWGKWRSSTATRRGGDVAVLLERLTMRDGLTFAEACAVLEINHGLTVDHDTLLRIYSTFRGRGRRHMVNDYAQAEAQPTPDRADTRMMDMASGQILTSAISSLASAMSSLEPEDRLLLELRFGDGMSVADVARTLKMEQKKLYRHFDRLLLMLRQHLEAAGIDPREVLATLGAADVEVIVAGLYGNCARQD